MLNRLLRSVVCLLCAFVLAGCATTPAPAPPETLTNAAKPAWSFHTPHEDIVVAVSPAGKTMRLAGSTGLLLGAGVDAAVNAKYRRQVEELLGDLDTNALFEARLQHRLEEGVGAKLGRVAPQTSTAGFSHKRDAQAAFYEQLAKNGYDLYLRTSVQQGLYGPQALLVAKLRYDVLQLPTGRNVTGGNILIKGAPVLASDSLGDPTSSVKPDFSAGLSVDGDAMDQWNAAGNGALKNGLAVLADGLASALLCDLGLADEATGHYYLGLTAMYGKDFLVAEKHLGRSLTLDPGSPDALNARAVNMAHNGQVDDAITAEEALLARNPDYGPAAYNLAWWLAINQENAAAARPYYQKALALGMARNSKLEKSLGSS